MNRRYLPLLLAGAMALPHMALPQVAAAQEGHERRPVPRIVVVGEGEAAVTPDMAVVTLSVMREAETAREALDEANQAMAAVIAAMKENGIEARDLQTSGLQINPRYVYPQNGGEEQPKIVAYQVSNTLTVRVRDIAMVGDIIDRSVTLGVNQGGSIAFTNDDPAPALTEARKRAVEDAMTRARTLAEAAGVSLGGILEISEQSYNPPPMPISVQAKRMEAAYDAVPVEAGENSYRITVNVTFEIDR